MSELVYDLKKIRNDFLLKISDKIIGPKGGVREFIHEPPHKQYLCGFLFPKDASIEDTNDLSEHDEDKQQLDLLFQRLPASAGLSFAVGLDCNSVQVEVKAARYIQDQDEELNQGWVRQPYHNDQAEVKNIDLSEPILSPIYVLEGHAAISIKIRSYTNYKILTVSLINQKITDKSVSVPDILTQVEMKCTPENGVIKYQDSSYLTTDSELLALELQYSNMPTFALGHACSAYWPTVQNGKVPFVRTSYLPLVEVPSVTTEIQGLDKQITEAFKLVNLSDNKFDPLQGFRAFVAVYREWAESLSFQNVEEKYTEVKKEILSSIFAAIDRAERGIDLLEKSSDAMRVFRLANHAMLLSMLRSRYKGDSDSRSKQIFQSSAFNLLDREKQSIAVWRPFQIFFFLMSLNGLWNETDEDRDIVDLIWFATGGGKTEAYLAVAAFEMLRRRMIENVQGTAVIKRYTLRLLTIQQFERAGGLICALESMRQDGLLQDREEYSLGLWVGGGATPNSNKGEDGAYDDLMAIFNTNGLVENNKIPLKACPCCSAAIIPAFKKIGDEGVGARWNKQRQEVELFCPNVHCFFHKGLPIRYVDESLYRHPPTMLLATVDKFAMLAWKPEARCFFGDGKKVQAPSLIIQDELHLISGPLGTVNGSYEAALDCIITAKSKPAKYICATATIRKAKDQIQKLYGRTCSIFPPAGLSAENSFFSKSESQKMGRLYIGALSQGHSPTFANVVASTGLLAASADCYEQWGAVTDTWWTLVAYHNSKRELGKSMTLIHDDVPARLRQMGESRILKSENIKELSSNLKDSQIPQMLEELKVSKNERSDCALDYVACTNMLSVGVDVPRLGLMMINGQPKMVSEYIQASSRVGRKQNSLPGVVFTLYSPSKPRDRSHYEIFRSFHQGFYRYVEPTSITPFADPALNRALHGAFLALIRMVSKHIYANEHAHDIFTYEDEIQVLKDLLAARMERAGADKVFIVEKLIKFIDEWKQVRKSSDRALMFYSSGSKSHLSLIKPFKSKGNGIETLQSLRNVDIPVGLKVKHKKRGIEA
ncbi:helicase-related protein [Acinetobacter sp. YH12136]|uniref:helicase-related protein n=1 Tax=Acinetobacter sp. YH12136 TaxID=2601120 RepID=UPI0015D421ED|nr:helicase-related protein [Acinetobacter sp. YH12136]